jgi:hypothetical protein
MHVSLFNLNFKPWFQAYVVRSRWLAWGGGWLGQKDVASNKRLWIYCLHRSYRAQFVNCCLRDTSREARCGRWGCGRLGEFAMQEKPGRAVCVISVNSGWEWKLVKVDADSVWCQEPQDYAQLTQDEGDDRWSMGRRKWEGRKNVRLLFVWCLTHVELLAGFKLTWGWSMIAERSSFQLPVPWQQLHSSVQPFTVGTYG